MKQLAAVLIAVLFVMTLTGCARVDTDNHVGMTIIRLNSKTSLAVSVTGAAAPTAPISYQTASTAPDGSPMHRVLQSGDGSILFAYDIQVRKETGKYRVELRPAKQGPTFDAVREVTLSGDETVKVELMEEAATGRKVEDVFRLLPAEGTQRGAEPNTLEFHLYHVHSVIRSWLHGN